MAMTSAERQQLIQDLRNKNAAVESAPSDVDVTVAKRVGKTLVDFFGNLLYGAVDRVEGWYDAFGTTVGGIVGLFDEELGRVARENVAVDNTSGLIDLDEAAKYSYLNDIGDFGQKAVRGVAQGVGGMLPSLAMGIAVPGSGLVSVGIGAAGSGVEEAFQQGAGYAEGMLYGTMVGGVEMLTEKIFGGATQNIFGKGYADDLVKKVLGDAVKTSLWKKAALEFGEEAVEEALATIIEPAVRKLASEAGDALGNRTEFGEDALKEYFTSEHIQQVLFDGIVGGLTGIVYGGTLGKITTKSSSPESIAAQLMSNKFNKDVVWANGKMTADAEKAFNAKSEELRAKLNERLSKSTAEEKEKYTKQYGIKFDAEGNIEAAAEQKGKYNQEAYSPSLQGEEDTVGFDTVDVVTEKQKKTIRFFMRLNNMSSYKVKIFIAKAGTLPQGAKAMYKDGVIILDEKAADTDLVGRMKVVHELTHSAEMLGKGAAYSKLQRLIVRALMRDPAIRARLDPAGDMWEKTKAAYAKQLAGKTEFEQQYIVATEIMAEHAASLFTDETAVRIIAGADKGYAQRVLDFFHSLIKKTSKDTEQSAEDKRFSAFARRAARVFKRALQESVGGVSLETVAKMGTAIDKMKALKAAVKSVAQKTQGTVEREGRMSLDSVDAYGNKLTGKQREFFKDSKAVDEDGNLLVLYHGTVAGKFTVFDAAFANPENDYGSGFYFTNNEVDVNDNYQEDGADLEAKIEKLSDRLQDNEGMDAAEAYEKAVKTLVKSSRIYKVYLNIKNPYYVGDALFKSEDYYNREDYDNDDDYIADVDSMVESEIEDAISAVESKYEWASSRDLDGLRQLLWEAYQSGYSAEDIKNASYNFFEIGSENGELANNDVIRIVIESLGYDGIIDNTVSNKWGEGSKRYHKMNGVGEDTTHFIAFQSNQIKLVTNKAPTESEDIRMSLDYNPEVHLARAVEKYGYTRSFAEAGYLTQRGRMLDFAGRRKGTGGRSIDHTDIAKVFDVAMDGYEAIVSFVREGNIRLQEGNGIDVSAYVEPTDEQYAMIAKFVKAHFDEWDEFSGDDVPTFYVDFQKDGTNDGQLMYEAPVSGNLVVSDMRRYYHPIPAAEGATPEEQFINNARYSLIGSSVFTKDISYMVGYETAKGMERDGNTPEAIRKKTGWYKSKDGNWKLEISDKGFKTRITKPIDEVKKPMSLFKTFIIETDAGVFQQGEIGKPSITLADIVDHPTLFELYPNLKNLPIHFDTDLFAGSFSKSVFGYYMTLNPSIFDEQAGLKRMNRYIDTIAYCEGVIAEVKEKGEIPKERIGIYDISLTKEQNIANLIGFMNELIVTFTKTVDILKTSLGKSKDKNPYAAQVIMHEVQHYIQAIERWSRGAATDEYEPIWLIQRRQDALASEEYAKAKTIPEKMDIVWKYQHDPVYNVFHNYAPITFQNILGEEEAEYTAYRIDLTNIERRLTATSSYEAASYIIPDWTPNINGSNTRYSLEDVAARDLSTFDPSKTVKEQNQTAYFITKTPNNLKALGIPERQFVVARNHLINITAMPRDPENHKHAIPLDYMKFGVSRALSEPAAVIEYDDGKAVIISTDKDSAGKPIVIGLDYNEKAYPYKGKVDVRVAVSTVYGHENISRFIKTHSDDVVYWNKALSQKVSLDDGRTLADLFGDTPADTVIRPLMEIKAAPTDEMSNMLDPLSAAQSAALSESKDRDKQGRIRNRQVYFMGDYPAARFGNKTKSVFGFDSISSRDGAVVKDVYFDIRAPFVITEENLRELTKTAAFKQAGIAADDMWHVANPNVFSDAVRELQYDGIIGDDFAAVFRMNQIYNIEDVNVSMRPDGKYATTIKAEPKGDVRYSLYTSESIAPQTRAWSRGASYKDIKAQFPELFSLDNDDADIKNPTQTTTTVSTYRKIFNMLALNGFKGNILDASSGLGRGTEVGREEYKFDIEAVEPFPAKGYTPDYTDYRAITKQYNVIISNAVINVIPQDMRDNLIRTMASLLKPNGVIFINTRGVAEIKANKTAIAINERNSEYYIASTGSYQKGFNTEELVSYLKDALGSGFNVEAATDFGNIAAVVRNTSADAIPERADARYSLGYHAGDLGKSESYADMMDGSRSTGHFGTGTYFVSNLNALTGEYKARPKETIELSNYNLYKPMTEYEADKLHRALKGVNKYGKLVLLDMTSDDYFEKYGSEPSEYDDVSGIDADSEDLSKKIAAGRKYLVKYGEDVDGSLEQRLEDAKTFDANVDEKWVTRNYLNDLNGRVERTHRFFNDAATNAWRVRDALAYLFGVAKTDAALAAVVKHDIKMADAGYKAQMKADSNSTVFMKAVGYEGVDVSYVPSFDNTTYGTVVYDLKAEDKARQKTLMEERRSKSAAAETGRFSIEPGEDVDEEALFKKFGLADAPTEEEKEALASFTKSVAAILSKYSIKFDVHYDHTVSFYYGQYHYIVSRIEPYSIFNQADYDEMTLNGVAIPLYKAVKTDEEAVAAVKEIIANHSNRDVDTLGNKLTKEQTQYFAKTQANVLGKPLRLYHGTTAPHFDRYNVEKAKWGSVFGAGFYTSNMRGTANDYSDGYGEVHEVYVNVTRPIKFVSGDQWNAASNDSKISLDETEEIIKYFAKDEKWIDKDYIFDIFYVKEEETRSDAIHRIAVDIHTKNHGLAYEILDEIAWEFGERGKYLPEFYAQLRSEFGYDGVIVDFGMQTWVIAFNSDQIKRTSNLKPTKHEDFRYSIDSDTEGNALTEAQQRRFMYSAVQKNGALTVMYHGTDAANIEEFDETKLMLNTGAEDAALGFHFTDSEIHAKQFGKNMMKFYIDLRKPMDFTRIPSEQMITDIATAAGTPVSEAREYLMEAFSTPFGMIELKYWLADEKFKNTAFFQKLQSLGYDGFIFDMDTNVKEYVALYRNQIKRTDNKAPGYGTSVRFSLDNGGRPLSPGMDDYMKASVVRDESGALVRAYHGSRNYGFDEFTGTKMLTKIEIGLRFAAFFTNNLNTARSYSETMVPNAFDTAEEALAAIKKLHPEYVVTRYWYNRRKAAQYAEDELGLDTYVPYNQLDEDQQETLEYAILAGMNARDLNTMLENTGEASRKVAESKARVWMLNNGWNPNTYEIDTITRVYIEKNGKTEEIGSYASDAMLRDKARNELELYETSADEGIYEGYINLTHPFIVDAKGANWSGIKNPFYDANSMDELRVRETLTTNEIVKMVGAMNAEHMRENASSWNPAELKYDGIVFKNVIDIGGSRDIWDKKLKTIKGEKPNVYIIFSPEQFKSWDNLHPTDNPKMRFSLDLDGVPASGQVEAKKNLIALHNLSYEAAKFVVSMGGMPVPSIAITKPENPFTEFGDITFVFNKDTINPSLPYNKVYMRDAWTVVRPAPRNPVLKGKKSEFAARFKESAKLFEEEGFMTDPSKWEETSAADFAFGLRYMDFMKYEYLKSLGQNPRLYRHEPRVGMGNISVALLKGFLKKHPDAAKVDINNYDEMMAWADRVAAYEEQYDYEQYVALGMSEEKAKKYAEAGNERMTSFGHIDSFFHGILIGTKYGWPTVGEVDRGRVSKMMDKRVGSKDAKFIKWIDEIVKPMFGELYYAGTDGEYVRNNLASLTDYMRSKGGLGAQKSLVYGLNKMMADSSNKEMRSIKAIKDYAERMVSTEKQSEIRDALSAFDEDVRGMVVTSEAQKKYGEYRVFDAFEDYYKGLARILGGRSIREGLRDFAPLSDEAAEAVKVLVKQIREFPADYFEAKPQRAVDIHEVKVAVMPKRLASTELPGALKESGVQIKFYKDDADRTRIVESLDKYRFSLPNEQMDTVKVLTKKELFESVERLVFDTFKFDRQGKYGEIKKKDIKELIGIIVDELEDKKSVADVAERAADFIIKHAMIKSVFDTGEANDWDNMVFNTLKSYFQKFDLSGIHAEIKYTYDKKAPSIYWVWGHRGAGKGMAPDVIAKELSSYGIEIEADNAADIFNKIVSMYEEARDKVNKKTKTIIETVGDVIGGETLNKMRAALKADIINIIAASAKEVPAESIINKKKTEIKALYKRIAELEKQLEDEKNDNGREALKGEIISLEHDIAMLSNEIEARSKTIEKIMQKLDETNRTVSTYKAKLYDATRRANAINRLFERVDRVAGLEKYAGAGVELAKEVIGLIKLLKGVKTWRGNIAGKVREIMQRYAAMTPEGKHLYELLSHDFTPPHIAQAIDIIAHNKGELSTDEIINLADILDNFIHNVREYDLAFYQGNKKSRTELIERGLDETGKTIPLKQTWWNKLKHWLEAPIWRFMRLSNYDNSGLMTGLFWEIQKGYNKESAFIRKVAKHFEAWFKEHRKEADGWHTDVVTINGVTLTRGQAMSIYMLSLRDQAKNHIYNQQYTVTNPDGSTSVVLKGTVRIVNDKLAHKSAKEAHAEGVDVEITPDTIAKIKAQFTDSEKDFMNLAAQFFNTISAEAKTETDVALYGVSGVLESHYFPIRVSEDEIYHNVAEPSPFKFLFSVINPSFNKDVVPNAKNKIVIENILDVVNRHSRQMAAYYGLAVPVRTFNLLYSSKTDKGMLSVAIRKVDPTFDAYVRQLFRDIQGQNPAPEGFTRFINKVRSLGAKAALAANLKVLANQMVSLFAAHGVGFKYRTLLKGMMKAMAGKTDFKLLTESSPMMFARFTEGFDIATGTLHEEAGAFGRVDKLTELALAPISWMDKIVIGGIWNAALEEENDNTQRAAERVEKAVIITQANYTQLFRPEILRSRDSFLQLSTMFMSEPLQVFSQLFGAVDRMAVAKELAKRATTAEETKYAERLATEAKRELKQAFTTVAVDLIILSIIEQAFKWLKDKDDEELDLMGFIKTTFYNLIGIFPFVKDIISIIEGYDVSNMAYTGLTNIVNAGTEMFQTVEAVINGESLDTVAFRSGWRRVILGLAQTFGIPLRNVESYIKGIAEKVAPAFVESWEGIYTAKTTKQSLDDLQKAVESGNERLADVIAELAIKGVLKINSEMVEAEIKRLLIAGIDAIPDAAVASFTYDGKEYTMTPEQYREHIALYGQAEAKVERLISMQSYKAATTDNKARIIRLIYDYYKMLARAEVIGDNITEEDARALNRKETLFKSVPLEKAAYVLAIAATLEADKDARGNPISGSKKKKVERLMYTVGLTKPQRDALFTYLGYAV